MTVHRIVDFRFHHVTTGAMVPARGQARSAERRASRRPPRNEISVFAGGLDDRHNLKPEDHIRSDRRFARFHIEDDLPRYGRFPPGYKDYEPD